MDETTKNELIEELMSDLKRRDKAYSLQGPQMLHIKRSDGTYRKKEVFGTEFLPSTGRMGKKRNVLFCFEPEDPQEEYVGIEVDDKAMDDTFPVFLEDVSEWAQMRYMPADASRGRKIESCKTMPGLMTLIFELEAEDREKAAVNDDSEMAAHPNFGMF